MYRLAFMVMYQQKLEQVAQVVLLPISTKMQAATAFRVSVVVLVVGFRLVVFGIWVVVLVLLTGVSAVRPVILPSEGCKGTDTHKFFERYIQPKVDLQEMRKLVSDHSKKQARERGEHI